MSENSKNPVFSEALPSQADEPNPESTIVGGKDEKALPSLSAYFGEKKLRPAAFVKAVNVARLKDFEEADRTSALDLMYKNDLEGKRLWALISLARVSDPINIWMWAAAKNRVSRVLGSEVDIASQTPEQLSEAVRKRFPALTSTKDKADKRAFLFSVRIIGVWLLVKRRIQPWDAIAFCSALICPDERNAGQVSSTAVRAGSDKDLRLAASVVFLGRRRLADIEAEADRAKAEVSDMRQRLERKITENSELQTTVDDIRKQNSDVLQELTDLRTQMETHRQHSGFDLTEVKAGNSVLLRDRLGPLIRDAIDALELDTPAPEVAVRRLKRAVSTIEESLK